MLTWQQAARANGRLVRIGWTKKTYTRMVAAGLKVVGFPDTEIFAHPCDIRGGIPKLEELTEMWESGEIAFAEATAEDVRAAEDKQVRRIFPGKWVDEKPSDSSNISRPSPDAPMELVLRATGLTDCFVLPMNAPPNPDAVARIQRCDLKRERKRRRHGSRAGIKTAPFLVPSRNTQSGEPALEAVPTHDRIDRYYAELESDGPEDEIDLSCDEPWFASSQALAANGGRSLLACI